MEDNRDHYKQVAKLANKNTNLRAYHAVNIYDYRIFTYDLGEYIERDNVNGKFQTNIILFYDRKAGVRTINIEPKEYRPRKYQYWLDSIEAFKTQVILEKWNGEKF